MAELLTTGEAAKLLDLSDEWVRQLEAKGQLTALRTERGYRLFVRRDVERLKSQREEAARANGDDTA